MTIKYYRSTAAYDAFAAFDERFKAHFEACRQFAARFDGKPVVRTTAHSVELAGVILNDWPNRDDADLWRKPDRKRGGGQLPRAGRGIPKDRTADAETLAEEWQKNMPGQLDRSGVWAALGVSWGDLFLAGMTHHLDHANKCLWIATGLTLGAEHATEVMASEYEAAVKAVEADERGES